MNGFKNSKYKRAGCFLIGLSLGLSALALGLAPAREVRSEGGTEAVSASAEIYNEWDAGSVYTGGNKVIYQGRIYRAKWWTQGEVPISSDVWEDTGETPNAELSENTADFSHTDKGGGNSTGDFRVVGYFPSWKPQAASSIRYDVLSHIIYAFAIPTPEGGLRPLENGDTAASIIREAHKNGAEVLLAVGGWSYNDTPLEGTFVQATATEEKRKRLLDAILEMCDTYGFDGIDMDWEHPRADGVSSVQYCDLMLALSEALHERGKILTSAVLSGATADGNIYYDAAAHSDAVLNSVDWINVMAYDGGDGERHSAYKFAVRSAEYWHIRRGIPSSKVVLGVPFYSRPGWASYADILAAVPDAWSIDCTAYNGMQVWYNGVETIRAKTRYALENLGGVMIWEITQDTDIAEKSLITAIGNEIAEQTEAEEAQKGFTDVPDNAYYAEAVKWAVENGIAEGTAPSTFSPNQTCTRDQIVTFLWRAAGSPKPFGTYNPFADVSENDYYANAVIWAIERGVAKGTDADSFSPSLPCTRGQAAAFLYRNAGSPTVSGNIAFTDVSADDYYAPAVMWAAANGIVKGTGTNIYSPNADCTRAQIVTMLYRLMSTR